MYSQFRNIAMQIRQLFNSFQSMIKIFPIKYRQSWKDILVIRHLTEPLRFYALVQLRMHLCITVYVYYIYNSLNITLNYIYIWLCNNNTY